MLSHSEFKMNVRIHLENISLADATALRKVLMSERTYLTKKNGDKPPTKKMRMLEDIIEQLWQQICLAREVRADINRRVAE